MGGLGFAQEKEILPIYRRQLKRILAWSVQIFFASTVAFSIPIKSMFTAMSFGEGILLGFFAITSKVLGGIWAKPSNLRWVAGFGLVARGEFAYLVARDFSLLILNDKALIGPSIYPSVVWGLLCCTLLGPILTLTCVGYYRKKGLLDIEPVVPPKEDNWPGYAEILRADANDNDDPEPMDLSKVNIWHRPIQERPDSEIPPPVEEDSPPPSPGETLTAHSAEVLVAALQDQHQIPRKLSDVKDITDDQLKGLFVAGSPDVK